MRARFHVERHVVERIGWLRAAVLGANDGIVSTASLIVGVAAGEATRSAVLVAGAAGLVAGAFSMAAGEYVSVSSQADAEAADLKREASELKADPRAEHAELSAIYRDRGLSQATADAVATELMAADALAAHARDELGIADGGAARPLQAALASAASFVAGAAMPLLVAALAPVGYVIALEAPAVLLSLAGLGALGARTGGASAGRAALRVTFWGALAMAATAAIGHLVGTAV